MAHAQKPDLVFQRNWRVHLNWRGGQFSRLLAAEVCASAVAMVVMLDTPCSEAECKTTGYPLHSHVSPSLPLPCVTMCHQVLNALYILTNRNPLLHHCLLNSYILHKIIVREVTVTCLESETSLFFLTRVGKVSRAPSQHMYHEGEGQLCEAGIWEAGWTEEVSNACCGSPSHHSRCRCVKRKQLFAETSSTDRLAT